MFSWRKFLGVFSQVLNVLAIFFQPLVIYAKLLSGALALASGGLKGGLIGAFGSMIPGFQSVKGIWDNIGNLMISTAVGGASAVIMGGRFKEGAIGALKSAAMSMTLGAIAEHTKSRQTGNKYASGADSEASYHAANGERKSNESGLTRERPASRARQNEAIAAADAAMENIYGRYYESLDALARDTAKAIQPISERFGMELGVQFFQVGSDGYYAGTITTDGLRSKVNVFLSVFENPNAHVAGDLHTHPVPGRIGFSLEDISSQWERRNHTSYVSQTYAPLLALDWNKFKGMNDVKIYYEKKRVVK